MAKTAIPSSLVFLQEKENKEREDILSLDLREPVSVTKEELHFILQDEPIAEYSDTIYQAAEETGINVLFLTALMVWESGWGEIPNSYENLYGWNGGEYSSVEDSIVPIAHLIKEKYLTEDGCYFEGFTLADVNVHYNGREQWLEGMTDVMYLLYQRLDKSRI